LSCPPPKWWGDHTFVSSVSSYSPRGSILGWLSRGGPPLVEMSLPTRENFVGDTQNPAPRCEPHTLSKEGGLPFWEKVGPPNNFFLGGPNHNPWGPPKWGDISILRVSPLFGGKTSVPLNPNPFK